MQDWNVVATIRERGFREAIRLLGEFGPVSRTDYYNVLVMKTDDPHALLESVRSRVADEPGMLNFLSRLVPAAETFDFQSREEFESHAREVVLGWAVRLVGKGFHVRVHRRGFKGRLSSMEAEHFLDGALLRYLENMGGAGRIDFENPDAIIAVETVGQRAGLSCWTRGELEDYPFLGLRD